MTGLNVSEGSGHSVGGEAGVISLRPSVGVVAAATLTSAFIRFVQQILVLTQTFISVRSDVKELFNRWNLFKTKTGSPQRYIEISYD